MTYEDIIENRMQRFNILLNNACFDFKQYQYDGVKWGLINEITKNPINNIRGGFIADEMGLGKTLTMIGIMFVNYLPKTLIVVPPILIEQWHNEILKTCGHNAILYYGKNKSNYTLQNLNNVPIVLTTYNTLCSIKCLLKNICWNRVIFDEAHHLRNHKTKRFQNSIKIRARIRWLITGTPVQNKVKDFHNLCHAVGMHPHFYKNVSNFKIIINNFFLRRTKKMVGIYLPPITTHKHIVKWSNIYEMRLAEEIHSLLSNQTNVSPNKKGQYANLISYGGHLTAIIKARQLCVLPKLVYKNIQSFIEMGIQINNDYIAALDYSSKIDAVIDLIYKRMHNKKGKIIFCHFKTEIDVIADSLKLLGITRIFCYDGRNSNTANLQEICKTIDVLIIQIQSGNEGLNLQNNFSEIYFVSPNWNPFIEDQAIARCHRIGQENNVEVFKFEMQGFDKDNGDTTNPITLEKYISKVHKIKRLISNSILQSI